jgi:trans-2,3-dihydro-3-hydroxyanthranilate isomerase
MSSLDYVHADVFTSEPFSGNSLAVFPDTPNLAVSVMLRITQELRHFESIFLRPTSDERTMSARIFDWFEELPFAGHPLIGAAAVLQHRAASGESGLWRFDLSGRLVPVEVEAADGRYWARLHQGRPESPRRVEARPAVAQALGLEPTDIRGDLPMEVGSTGLSYLVVPLVAGAIARARIARDISDLLRCHGAQFAVLFDPAEFEIRHWNNDGVIEDVATGSAAGVVAAYALRYGLITPDTPVVLRQGRFVGRPSKLTVWAAGGSENVTSIHVGGDVVMVGSGTLWRSPPDVSAPLTERALG